MGERTSAGFRLRQAWAAGPVALPGVFCPLVARMAEGMGFRAVYLSGAALSASLALPDIGLVGATEFADAARAITAATTLPLLCDADTGFGEALNVERTVRLYEAAGAAGLHLEDQQSPKRCGHLSGKTLVDARDMAAKIRAATRARHDADFVIVARTDARGVQGFDEAVRRARLYVEAGADVVFPEALENADEFAAFARSLNAACGREVPLLANMTEFGRSPVLDLARLGGYGYRLVIYPVTAFRSALRAARDTLAAIQTHGHQRDVVPGMLTRQELYALLGYEGYDERDRAYFQ